MKSTAELQEIREKLRVEIGYSCAIGKDDTKVAVRMSDDAIGAADKVVRALMEEIEKRNVAHVKVVKEGSVEKLDGEPIVEVTAPGKAKATYTNVNADKAREIIASINK